MYKPYIKTLLIVLFVGAVISVLLAGHSQAERWLNTASCLFALAAIAQLNVSGFFNILIEMYSDETKYPYGPPSHFVRQVIDHPDTPFRSWAYGMIFFDVRFGQALVIASILSQLAAAWLA